ncbi:MAG: hypothetical protein ACOYOK_06620 [Pseudobdellovibrionaceae bacterium]
MKKHILFITFLSLAATIAKAESKTTAICDVASIESNSHPSFSAAKHVAIESNIAAKEILVSILDANKKQLTEDWAGFHSSILFANKGDLSDGAYGVGKRSYSRVTLENNSIVAKLKNDPGQFNTGGNFAERSELKIDLGTGQGQFSYRKIQQGYTIGAGFALNCK